MNKLLALVVVDDYHDIAFVADQFLPKAKYIEIGTTYNGPRVHLMYVGIIYTGPKPSQSEIDDLLFRNNIILEKE